MDEAKRDKETPAERSNQCRRFWLVTHPRTASHLLVHMLGVETQPNVAYRDRGGYFFLQMIVVRDLQLRLRGRHVEDWTQDERAQTMRCYQACFDELEGHLKRAEADGRIVFVKEHAGFMTEPTAQTRFLFGQDSVKESPWTVQVPSTYGPGTHSSLNETVMPDEFLQTWRPTFLIRHPALVFPSHYRTIRDTEGAEVAGTEESYMALNMTMHWSRTPYDWYTQHFGGSGSEPDGGVTWPLVVDADDMMAQPEMVAPLCEIVGMDAARLPFSRETVSEEDQAQQSPVERRMRDTLNASVGVVEGKTWTGLDVAAEAKKWREEFGQRDGESMGRWVRAAMADHEFMRARRPRPRPDRGRGSGRAV